jgi:hypothetical protein
MGYAFAQLLAYDLSFRIQSARVRESMVCEMVRLSCTIINLATGTTDERTKHLSDHIYHMITFAALTICRLVSAHEAQLTQTHNIAELDILVINLVSWLRGIGLPCHAASTLASIISAYQRKLRPTAQLSTSPTLFADIDLFADSSFWAAFPDMLAPDAFGFSDTVFLPS